MKLKYHKDLTEERWNSMSLVEQMANVGSEVSRAINWKGSGSENYELSFYRALELLQMTMSDSKNKHGLKELARVKEMLVDWFFGNPLYVSTDDDWNKYFLQYNIAARLDK